MLTLQVNTERNQDQNIGHDQYVARCGGFGTPTDCLHGVFIQYRLSNI